MDFLIDECVLGRTKRQLQERGFSVTSVIDLGKASASNGEVLSLAKQKEAILITTDLHFSNISLYPLGTHSGIIVLRLRSSESPEEIEKVHQVLGRLFDELAPSELKQKLIIVDRNKYRIHTE